MEQATSEAGTTSKNKANLVRGDLSLSVTSVEPKSTFSLYSGGAQSDEHLLSYKTRRQKFIQLGAVILVLILSILGVVALAVIWCNSQEAPFDYAMVFDAGSSHTEMVLYKWHADKFRGTGVVSQVTSCEMKGGIGKVLRVDPALKAPPYFATCLEMGLSFIPEDRRAHSPVFLAATAGMRLLRLEDPKAALEILGNVSLVLQQSGLLMSPSSVRVISGTEEAVAGWISANYLLHTIYPVKDSNSPVGTLDLGGASTQVTFIHSALSSPSVMLYGKRHDLHAHSYLCYGTNEAAHRYSVLLVQDQHNETATAEEDLELQSPCHNEGYSESLTYDDFINSCSETQFTPSLRNVTVKLVGTSDPEECAKATRSLLDTQLCKRNFKSQECFEPPPQHSASTHFVAVSAFFYTMKSLRLDNNASSVEEFLYAVQEKCNASWAQLQNSPGFDPEFSPQECFTSSYVAALLLHGYSIKDETWRNIDFLKKVNNTSVGWTLGFTIWNTNAFPEEAAVASIPVVTFTVVLSILAFLIGVCGTLLLFMLVKSINLKRNRLGNTAAAQR